MPQTSALHSAARIRVIEKNMLTRENIDRLLESSAADCVRLITEWGYGGSAGQDAGLEARISAVMRAARATMLELSVDTVLTDTFLMAHDVNNLKYLIKLRLQKREADTATLSDMGIIEPKLMQLMVKNWEFPALPAVFGQSLDTLDKALAKQGDKFNPQTVSVAVDKAYFTYARSLKKPFLNSYFSAKCDFTNIITFMRLKALNADTDAFMSSLMPKGEIECEKLISAYNQSQAISDKKVREQLFNGVKNTELLRAIDSGLNSAADMERAEKNYLIDLCKRGKSDMETVLPVIGYYLGRERETECVRMIVTLKQNGVSDSKILERVGKLYG